MFVPGSLTLPRKFLFPLFLFCASVRAAPSLPDTYRHVLDAGVANGAYPVLAVGLIDGKERGAWYLGAGADGRSAANADSAFEIGAVSEIFAGLLLAHDAAEGQRRLSEPLRAVLPGVTFADARVGEITLAQLITHHSGLPPMPTNLFPADADDPYADYAESDLLRFLANVHLPAGTPGYTYSAVNPALLALLLGRAHAQTYPALLSTRVLRPLGLAHATFEDPPTLLDGHLYGQIEKHWHYAALGGAAGLRATLPDLLAFAQQNLTPDVSPLRAPLLLARQPRATGENSEVGLGWNIRQIDATAQSWPLVWRASETAGFSSFIGFRADRQRALVLLTNAAEDLAALGIAWLCDEPPPPAPRAPHAPSAATLAGYPGLYRITAGNEVIVRAHDDRLSLQMLGQPPWRLRGYDDDAFVANSGAVGVAFVRDLDRIGGMVLRLGNTHVTATRLSAHAPRLLRPVLALEAAQLASYAGWYQIDPDMLLRIEPAAQGLTIQLTGAARTLVKPYAQDRFADADGAYELTFQRDKSGVLRGVALELAGFVRQAQPVHWH